MILSTPPTFTIGWRKGGQAVHTSRQTRQNFISLSSPSEKVVLMKRRQQGVCWMPRGVAMQWHFAQSDWHEQKANNGAQNSYQYTRVSGALSVSHLEIDTTDTCDHNSHQYTRVSGSLSMFHLETFFFPVMIFFSTLLCSLNSLIPKIVLSCRLYIYLCVFWTHLRKTSFRFTLPIIYLRFIKVSCWVHSNST